MAWSAPVTSRRVLAVLLSLLVPGAGQAVLGRTRRGLAWAIGVPLSSMTIVPLGMIGVVIAALFRVGSGVDAWLLAPAADRLPSNRRGILLLLGMYLGGGAVALGVRDSVVEAYRIPAGSMEPTLVPGDHVMVDKRAYGFHAPLARPKPKAPARGDVVVFAYPPDPRQTFVKRVVAVPGDRIAVRDDQVFVNDQPEPEGVAFVAKELIASDFPTGTGCPPRMTAGPDGKSCLVPDDAVFVMGDNRRNSADSRHWGVLPVELVKGRAKVVWLSLPPQGGGVAWSRVGRAVRLSRSVGRPTTYAGWDRRERHDQARDGVSRSRHRAARGRRRGGRAPVQGDRGRGAHHARVLRARRTFGLVAGPRRRRRRRGRAGGLGARGGLERRRRVPDPGRSARARARPRGERPPAAGAVPPARPRDAAGVSRSPRRRRGTAPRRRPRGRRRSSGCRRAASGGTRRRACSRRS